MRREISDVTVILEMNTLIGQLDSVREDYIRAGGLQSLLAVYWDNHNTINVERFAAALLALLPRSRAPGVSS